MTEARVVHTRYGAGVVKGSRHKGFQLLVAFDTGPPRWVRADEIQFLTPPGCVHVESSRASTSLRGPLRDRRMIEAFRLGIVPHDCVHDFTFGREKEMDELGNWLDRNGESVVLLVGEYGTGKTHLLQCIYGKAIQDGFAAAYVEMDPNESPFHKPKRVYNHLTRTLRFLPQQGGNCAGFRQFVEAALYLGAYRDHLYFTHLVGRTEEPFWLWAEGEEAFSRPIGWNPSDRGYLFSEYRSLPGLYDYSTAANIYCYMLSALGWAARSMLSLKGLVLLFDEAESVDAHMYTYQRDKSINFLRALIRTAANDEALLSTPTTSDLDYCRVGIGCRVPFLYRRPSGLKLVFAFTPIYALDWLEELQSAPRIEIDRLSDAALREAFDKICLNSSFDVF